MSLATRKTTLVFLHLVILAMLGACAKFDFNDPGANFLLGVEEEEEGDDGNGDEGETCSVDRKLGVFADEDSDGVIPAGTKPLVEDFQPIKVSKDFRINYYSWSVHPNEGPEPKGYQGNIALYESDEYPGQWMLGIVFSQDDDGSRDKSAGSPDNTVHADLKIKNGTSIVLSDDDGRRPEASIEADVDGFMDILLRMRYWFNTDSMWSLLNAPTEEEDTYISFKLLQDGDNKYYKFFYTKKPEVAPTVTLGLADADSLASAKKKRKKKKKKDLKDKVVDVKPVSDMAHASMKPGSFVIQHYDANNCEKEEPDNGGENEDEGENNGFNEDL